MATFKLKNIETGLYWKGGSDIPFEIPEDLSNHCSRMSYRFKKPIHSKNQWSKVGKAWANEAFVKSAITNCVKHSLYIKLTKDISTWDYCIQDFIIGQFNKNVIIEKFTNPEEIKFNDFYEAGK